MFGMGMTEIMVILVIALIFLGPEKLPEAASKISKGIRDIRKQTRELTSTIENDTEIGASIRELKSALRGEDIRRPPVRKEPPAEVVAGIMPVLAGDLVPPGTEVSPTGAGLGAHADPLSATVPLDVITAGAATTMPLDAALAAVAAPPMAAAPAGPPPVPALTLPPTAGVGSDDATPDDVDELAKLIRPVAGTAKREGRG